MLLSHIAVPPRHTACPPYAGGGRGAGTAGRGSASNRQLYAAGTTRLRRYGAGIPRPVTGGRPVAVKIIHPHLAADPEFRVRFAREANAARRISGIFTAPVINVNAGAPLPWLVTGYVHGPSLAAAVAAHGPLPVSSVLTLAAGLAEGLGAAHAAGVVHRDLKPANVLLAADGARLIDLGISQAAGLSQATRAGVVAGFSG